MENDAVRRGADSGEHAGEPGIGRPVPFIEPTRTPSWNGAPVAPLAKCLRKSFMMSQKTQFEETDSKLNPAGCEKNPQIQRRYSLIAGG